MPSCLFQGKTLRCTKCQNGTTDPGSFSRTLVHPGPSYPEGPTHVIPLLIDCLPGIDPNDMRKAILTFRFLSTFCCFIPIVDSSDAFQYYPNLTEEERIICGQTAQFEDFLIQFLDRCFVLIESSCLEQTRYVHYYTRPSNLRTKTTIFSLMIGKRTLSVIIGTTKKRA